MNSILLQQWLRTYATLGALLLVCTVFAYLSPQAFATLDNAINVSRQIAFLVLIALGATFVMAAGEFDLSVGAMASFAGVMSAQLAVSGMDVTTAVVLTLGLCGLMGMFNGWLVGYFGVLSFITTLASKGIGVRVLMHLAGHRSISTTQAYIDVNDDMKRRAVELV